MAHVEVGAEIMTAPAKPEVEVLLATYYGERFLREQIDSILAQDYAEDYPILRILARDDGSSDGTPTILAEYASRFPRRIRVMPDAHPTGGAKTNFLELMKAAGSGFVCFADQDDVWLPDKVSRSMEAMRTLEQQHGADNPLMVFSDLRVVDAELKTIAPSMWRQTGTHAESVHRLERLVGQSVVTGCTLTINHRMLELARRMPNEATMHDRWIALIAAAMGAAAIVPGQTVLYRQHGANVVGASAPDDSLAGIARRGSDSTGRRAERLRSEKQAEALLRVYAEELPQRSRQLLAAYLRSGRRSSAAGRVLLTLRYGFFRGGVLKSLGTVLDLARSRSDVGLDVGR
jgi:Glycosyl transferase family 2